MDETGDLPELAGLILSIARQLRPPADLQPGQCTPMEIMVMRYVHRNPGTSSRRAADALFLPSSNFSRIVRALEEKGLVRREGDAQDSRGVRLLPTPLADENQRRLHSAWYSALSGVVDDPAAIARVNATLRQIEAALDAAPRQ